MVTKTEGSSASGGESAESMAEDLLKRFSSDSQSDVKKEPATKENAGGGSSNSEVVLGGRQPVVKLEPLKTDPLKPVAFHIGMSSKQILDTCNGPGYWSVEPGLDSKERGLGCGREGLAARARTHACACAGTSAHAHA